MVGNNCFLYGLYAGMVRTCVLGFSTGQSRIEKSRLQEHFGKILGAFLFTVFFNRWEITSN
jgi:hypothetical protein